MTVLIFPQFLICHNLLRGSIPTFIMSNDYQESKSENQKIEKNQLQHLISQKILGMKVRLINSLQVKICKYHFFACYFPHNGEGKNLLGKAETWNGHFFRTLQRRLSDDYAIRLKSEQCIDEINSCALSFTV